MTEDLRPRTAPVRAGSPRPDLSTRPVIAALPKIDLHRHLEGSLRLGTALEVARTYGLRLPIGTSQLRPLVQVTRQDPLTFRNFLSKFETLRNFYQSPEVVQRVTYEAVSDAAGDNVKYLELRFTPMALAKARSYSLDDVTGWVLEAAGRAARENDITVRLIASMNRNEGLEIGAEVTRLAIQHYADGIVGLDLAGDEVNYPAEPFAELFQEARRVGLGITVHAGEWTGAPSVRHAIETMQAHRIGHGVRVLEDPEVAALARARGVYFEVCPTSNLQSGVVSRMEDHPLPQMIEAGLRVTLNTDDPGVSDITLTDELLVAVRQLGLSPEALRATLLNSARAAFLPRAERAALEATFRARLDAVLPPA